MKKIFWFVLMLCLSPSVLAQGGEGRRSRELNFEGSTVLTERPVRPDPVRPDPQFGGRDFRDRSAAGRQGRPKTPAEAAREEVLNYLSLIDDPAFAELLRDPGLRKEYFERLETMMSLARLLEDHERKAEIAREAAAKDRVREAARRRGTWSLRDP